MNVVPDQRSLVNIRFAPDKHAEGTIAGNAYGGSPILKMGSTERIYLAELVNVDKFKEGLILPLHRQSFTDDHFNTVFDHMGASGVPFLGAHIGDSRCTPKILERVSKIDGVKTLNLASTGVTDNDLLQVAGLHRIHSLWLANCPITNQGVANITGMQGLKALDLTGTKITLDVVPELAKFKLLEQVRLTNTSINDDDGREISRAKLRYTAIWMNSKSYYYDGLREGGW
jgi:hypothetical protein